MDVAVTGASGLIGSALCRSLENDGHRVVRLVRRPPSGADEVRWNPVAGTVDREGLVGIDAIVHLAGAGIGDKRWTEKRKREIVASRVVGTTAIAAAVALLDPKPVLVSGSAIGYYGDRGSVELTEQSPPGDDFVARVCVDWEKATSSAEAAGARVAHVRSGIVLSTEGGALRKQVPLFRFGLGGKIGGGRQWLSWIAIDDEVRAIRFLLEHDVAGPVNLTAPGAVTNAEFTKALAHALHRPALVPVPRLVGKLPFGVGDLLDNLLFTSARIRPAVLTAAGFTFEYPDLDAAFRHLFDA